jgi:hypothetical protein
MAFGEHKPVSFGPIGLVGIQAHDLEKQGGQDFNTRKAASDVSRSAIMDLVEDVTPDIYAYFLEEERGGFIHLGANS